MTGSPISSRPQRRSLPSTKMKDGKPDLVTFQLKDGTYILPKVVDQGYLEIGKHRLEFQRKGHSNRWQKRNKTPEVTVRRRSLQYRLAVRDKRILPEGVVPKQAQAYVVAGLAVLILLAVMFSKNHAKPAPKGYGFVAGGYVHGRQPAQDSGIGAGPERRPAPEPAADAKNGKWHFPATAANETGPVQTAGTAPAGTIDGYTNGETA